MRLIKTVEVGEKLKTMNVNSGDFLFLSMKMQILRSLAKQEDISDSERQNAGDLIIDLKESIKPMSTGWLSEPQIAQINRITQIWQG